MTDVVITEDALQTRIRELGQDVTRAYEGRELDLVCLINGASMFCADLMRHIRVPVRQHFLGFSAYDKGSRSGEVRLTLDVAEPLEGRHVLVVEGIVVSGRTPRYVMELLKLRGPASIALCALGVKPQSLAVDLAVSYRAFDLGPEILVGYGVGSGPQRALAHLVSIQPGNMAH